MEPHFIIPSNYATKKIMLSNNGAVAGSTAQTGNVFHPEIRKVVSVAAHQVVVPIKGTPSPYKAVFLKLWVNDVELNQFTGPNGFRYAMCIHLKQNYVGDTTAQYEWPSDMFPVWSSEKSKVFGHNWRYEWVLIDGTPYPMVPGDEWVVELIVVHDCRSCPQQKFEM